MNPKITLDQWLALLTVVDAGGYAQAAEILNKSQSAVTYAVQKLESMLNVKAFEVQGRKAVLTPTGQILYRRAKVLLAEAESLERAAGTISAGWETEIRLAVEVVFPNHILLKAIDRLGRESPHTRIEIIESVLSGTSDALLQGKADLAISPRIPPGFLGDFLMNTRFIAVAHPDHPLHHMNRLLTREDLRAHRHIIVRDTSERRDSAHALEATQRWTVSNMSTSIQAVAWGYGFAWFPEEKIREELNQGRLKPLPLREGQEHFAPLYMIFADPDSAGPATRRLAECLREEIDRCNKPEN